MKQRFSSFAAFALAIAIVLSAINFSRVAGQSVGLCFEQTGHCIQGRIREFWEQNGGLRVFGFPTTPQQPELIEGRWITVQWFERHRLELHPENLRPYDVLLGRLGVDRLVQLQRNWTDFPKQTQSTSCILFEETGHPICEPFLTHWRNYGLEFDGKRGTSFAESLALFGLPISSLQRETLSDGKDYVVQWFERARFELHPENQQPYVVLFGLLGNEIRSYIPPTPTPLPATIIPSPTRRPRRPEPTPEPAYPAPTITLQVPTLRPYPLSDVPRQP
jgi:hypothetical protein